MRFPEAPTMEFGQAGLAEYEEIVAYRGRPQPPQSVEGRGGSLEVVIFWTAPANQEGIAGWRVFKDNENNMVWQSMDPNIRQTTIKVPGNSSAMFYVCSVTELQRESPKIPVYVASNTDQMVVTGTGGATAGSASAPASEWFDQPGGGRYDSPYTE